jgi:hypothetical protein
LARAYLDQLERSQGLDAANIAGARQALAEAERASGGARRSALVQLAERLSRSAGQATDGAKVRKLAAVVGELAGSQ